MKFARQNSVQPRTKENPQIHDPFAIAYVALTIVIMAYSNLFTVFPILLFYVLWLPHVFIKGRFILYPSKNLFLPALFVTFCALSIFWSDYPNITARAALEFVSMIACTVIIARAASLRAFIKGIMIGASLVLVATFIDGTYAVDYFSGTSALVGLFGSKNQVGFIAEIGIFASLLYLFSDNKKPEKILFSSLPFLISITGLILSRSAASVTSLAVALGVSCAACFIMKLSRSLRVPVLVLGITVTIALAVAGLYLGWENAVFHALGKSESLTGRTYLWSEGIKVGLRNPFFGHGYYAFWVTGQPDAEKYWYQFLIFNRTGFHFHSLFIETFVELGCAGLLLMAAMIAANCLKSLHYTFKKGRNMLSIFSLGMAFMLLARAFVEVDFLGPFGLGPLLFYSIIPRLALKAPSETKAMPVFPFAPRTKKEPLRP